MGRPGLVSGPPHDLMARNTLRYSIPVYTNTATTPGSNVGRLRGYIHILIVTGMFLFEDEIQDFIDEAIDEDEGVYAMDGEPEVNEISPETRIYNVRVKGKGFGTSPLTPEIEETGTVVVPAG